MPPRFIITGTDTGIGKTVVAALFTLGLDGCYWKPVQSGLEQGQTDCQRVRALTQLPEARFLPEAYVLSQPLSPHRAAELDGVVLTPETIAPPACTRPLIIEGAGGLMVPLNRHTLQIDQFAAWNIPVILCARTGLGTINHTLLSIAALRARNMAIAGLVFVGEENPDNIETIAGFSGCRVLGHLPLLPTLNRAALAEAFSCYFHSAL